MAEAMFFFSSLAFAAGSDNQGIRSQWHQILCLIFSSLGPEGCGQGIIFGPAICSK
jgi:hypothetical protein